MHHLVVSDVISLDFFLYTEQVFWSISSVVHFLNLWTYQSFSHTADLDLPLLDPPQACLPIVFEGVSCISHLLFVALLQKEKELHPLLHRSLEQKTLYAKLIELSFHVTTVQRNMLTLHVFPTQTSQLFEQWRRDRTSLEASFLADSWVAAWMRSWPDSPAAAYASGPSVARSPAASIASDRTDHPVQHYPWNSPIGWSSTSDLPDAVSSDDDYVPVEPYFLPVGTRLGSSVVSVSSLPSTVEWPPPTP